MLTWPSLMIGTLPLWLTIGSAADTLKALRRLSLQAQADAVLQRCGSLLAGKVNLAAARKVLSRNSSTPSLELLIPDPRSTCRLSGLPFDFGLAYQDGSSLPYPWPNFISRLYIDRPLIEAGKPGSSGSAPGGWDP